MHFTGTHELVGVRFDLLSRRIDAGLTSPFLGRNIAKRLGERPEVPSGIAERTLTLPIRIVGRVSDHHRASPDSPVVDRVDGTDP